MMRDLRIHMGSARALLLLDPPPEAQLRQRQEHAMYDACADPEIFARGGPTMTTFFLQIMREGDLYSNKSGPSSAHQRNAI